MIAGTAISLNQRAPYLRLIAQMTGLARRSIVKVTEATQSLLQRRQRKSRTASARVWQSDF